MIRPSMADLVPPRPIGAPTAGEWTYDPETGQVNCEGGTICTGVAWKPNGVLIQAANDLLEAALLSREMLTLELEDHQKHNRGGQALAVSDALGTINAAIAKAEGRS